MGLGLVVAIVGMCWSWGWSVDTGKGATFGPELPLAEVVVTVAVVDLIRLDPPLGCGFLGQSVLVAVDDGSHVRLPWGWGCGLVTSEVRWH